MANQPKGGYATAIIIIVMLGMIIFYMIMVYPSERQRLLRENNQSVSTSALYLDKNVYYVGNGEPAVNFQYNVSNLEIGYPLKNVKLKEDSLSLSANVIKPQLKSYSFVPSNETEGYKIFLEVNSIDGALYVISGKDVLKEITMPGTYELNVPSNFVLKFSHKGFAFWTTQHAEVKVTVYEEKYDDTRADVKIKIPVNDVIGEFVGIKFNAEGSGNVEILLNGKKIFYGELLNETEIQLPLEEANVKSVNTIEFVSEKGADYKVSNFSFYLFSGPSPSLSKVYFIEPIDSDVKIGIKVQILKPGTLSIAVMPKGTIFFLGKNLVQNGWNYFVVNESFMNETHAIKVFSVDGKFEIQEFKIEKV